MDGRSLSKRVYTYSGFVKIDGALIHYEIAGSGKPVVFIHGFGLDLRMWDEQFAALAETHQVMRYDVRGFGRSSISEVIAYTHAEDLRALLDLLDMQNPCLVGLSMGGQIALSFALAFPEKTPTLVLVDSALNGFRWSADWNASWREMAREATEHGPKAANELWLAHPLFAPAREQSKVRERLDQMVGKYSGWHWDHLDPHRQISTPNGERLGEINAPTLVLVGERDLPDFHAISDCLRDGIRNAEKAVIHHAGHMSNMEAPDQFLLAIGSFLESH